MIIIIELGMNISEVYKNANRLKFCITFETKLKAL